MRSIVLSAVIALFCVSLGMFSFALYRYESSLEHRFLVRQEIDAVIDDVCSEMNGKVITAADNGRSRALREVEEKYAGYGMSLSDVSSVLQPDNVPGSVLKKCAGKIFLEKSSGKSYGWVSTGAVDSNLYEFPVKNSLAALNIYFADRDVLDALLEVYGVKEDVRRSFFSAVDGCDVPDDEDLAERLKLKDDSELRKVIGVKTNFWCADFIYEDRFRARAIICALPENEVGNRIKEYKVIERYLDVL